MEADFGLARKQKYFHAPHGHFYYITSTHVSIMFIQAIPQKQNSVQTFTRLRQKIKDVFGQETSMNDDMLQKRYTLSSDGDLILILR
jgi:hypothetical protein